MTTLSFIWNNWAIILAVFLAVIALGAAAWFFKNWKFIMYAVIVACVYFAGEAIWNNGYNTRNEEELTKQAQQYKAEIVRLNKRADDLNKANAANTEQALADAAKIQELETQANATPPNSNACLDVDSARRVRSIR